MTRQLLSTSFAFICAVLMVGVAAGPAFASHYQAEPVAVPAKPKIVLRDVVWNCGEGACSAGQSASRPAIVCASLAKAVGPLRSFSVKGEALAGAELEKCNARAE